MRIQSTMKFSLAAGILAQTLPTLSKKVSSWDNRAPTSHDKLLLANLGTASRQTAHRNVGEQKLQTRQDIGLKLQRVLRNTRDDMKSHIPCNPTSVDPDTGILSCGQGYFCKPNAASDLGGVCSISSYVDNEHQGLEAHPLVGFVPRKSMNVLTAFQQAISNNQECDPASPDQGILACGDDKVCQQDESSELGGFCKLNDSSQRRLYDLEFAVSLCDRSPSEGYADCDCSGVNMTTGSGTVYCLNTNLTVGYGCDNVIFSDTYWIYLSNAKLAKMYDCYEILVPSYEKVCVTSTGEYLNESCSFSFNGQDCNSCSSTATFFDFDCTNVGGTAGSTLAQASTIVAECYVAPTFNCTNICGQGFHIPDYNSDINVTLPNLGTTSCGFLLYLDESVLIPDTDCAVVSDAAQTECCKALDPSMPPNEPTDDEPADDPVTPDGGEDTGSAGSFLYEKYVVVQSTLGLLIVLLTKGT